MVSVCMWGRDLVLPDHYTYEGSQGRILVSKAKKRSVQIFGNAATRSNISAPKFIHTVLITYWKWCENLKFVWIYTDYLVKGFFSKKLVKGLHYKIKLQCIILSFYGYFHTTYLHLKEANRCERKFFPNIEKGT